MTDFTKFSNAVAKRFKELSKGELFTAAVANGLKKDDGNPVMDGDHLWTTYLAAFPEGTNNIFRKRPEFDCACCRNFIKNVGLAIALDKGVTLSVWDIDGLEYPFDVVAAKLKEVTVAAPIGGLFRRPEKKYGAEFTVESLEGGTHRWNHFYGTLGDKHFTKFVDRDRGARNNKVNAFARGLKEIRLQDLDTIIGLCTPPKPNASADLYRGQEHLSLLTAYRRLKVEYDALTTDRERSIFVWTRSETGDAITSFHNVSIGKLVHSLSEEDADLEVEVRKYEAMVAGPNYKRTTALISPAMIKAATEKIEELGLEPALHRRHAKLSDISVNNVLWVDGEARAHMKGGLSDLLLSSGRVKSTTSAAGTPKVISIGDFMDEVVPSLKELHVKVTNDMTGNFMSITAPQLTSAPNLFKWDNGFAWSYAGNITDSIKDRVKRAGGNVTNAALRVSLAWYNPDDLDIHVHEPSGSHIYYHNKCGKLDVDMNGLDRHDAKAPVENVSWLPGAVRDGQYRIVINQYNRRSTNNPGFELEVESMGQLQHFRYESPVRDGTNMEALVLTVKAGKVVAIKTHADLQGGLVSKDIWGVETEKYVKVNTLMKSPNHWDGNEVGLRHWFFILEGCRNPDPVRGIYNEFLRSELNQHGKVLEVLGDKTKVQPTDHQLSGVGFSSQRSGTVNVRAMTAQRHLDYSITF